MDPAAELIQRVKKQRERIYNDDIYFLSSKPPKNAPEWAFDASKVTYETYETDGCSESNGNEELSQDYVPEEYVPEEPDLTDQYSDYILNSAEMNAVRPEDLDEPGESSTAVSWIILYRKYIAD